MDLVYTNSSFLDITKLLLTMGPVSSWSSSPVIDLYSLTPYLHLLHLADALIQSELYLLYLYSCGLRALLKVLGFEPMLYA